MNPCSSLIHSPPLNVLKQIIQIIIVPSSTAPPIHDNLTLLLLLLLRNRTQQLLQLLFCDFCADLARAGEGDEAVFDVGGAGLFDEADAVEAVGGFGEENLGEDGGTLVGFALSVRTD